jgi:hypothetical protein
MSQDESKALVEGGYQDPKQNRKFPLNVRYTFVIVTSAIASCWLTISIGLSNQKKLS